MTCQEGPFVTFAIGKGILVPWNDTEVKISVVGLMGELIWFIRCVVG